MSSPLDSFKNFCRFVRSDYTLSTWEKFPPADPRFMPGTTYADLGATRNFTLCNFLADNLPPQSRVLDIGIYPGTQAKLIKLICPSSPSVSGIGLCLSEEFREHIGEYISEIHEIDLDPFYVGLGHRIEIPFPDNSFDACYAMEVVEHLISPLPMLREAARTLKPGGWMIMSTPNVSHFGALVSIMRGKSNYEALNQSPMSMPENQWRGHIRTYAKDELVELGCRNGLQCVSHQYYLEKGHERRVWSGVSMVYSKIRKLVGALVPFWREDQIVIYRKEAQV